MTAVQLTLLPNHPTHDIRLHVEHGIIRYLGLDFIIKNLQADIRFDASLAQVRIQQHIDTLILPALFAQGQQARLRQSMHITLQPVMDWQPTLTLQQLAEQIKSIEIQNISLQQAENHLQGHANISIQQDIQVEMVLNMQQQQLKQVLSATLLEKALQRGIIKAAGIHYVTHLNFNVPCSLNMDCQ